MLIEITILGIGFTFYFLEWYEMGYKKYTEFRIISLMIGNKTGLIKWLNWLVCGFSVYMSHRPYLTNLKNIKHNWFLFYSISFEIVIFNKCWHKQIKFGKDENDVK